ncbi:MAG: peroxiredoxin [Bacteroidetes bacterium]|nr:peroxiredoxin [Bacteroidota bacterium]
MALPTGIKAPDFKLFNSEKKEVSLSDFKGNHNVIIHFFPAAFTGTCTEQLCNMRDNLNYYTGLGCVVLGISVDMLFSLAEFKKQQNYNFDLLSDFNKEVSKAYDMLQENFAFGMKGVSKRGAFVIDKEGTIVYSEETANPGVQVSFDAIKAAVEKLK